MTCPPPARWTINGRFLTQPTTGVQRYAGEVTRAMDERLAADEAIARRLRLDIVVPADGTALPRYDVITARRSRRGRGYAWEQLVLPAAARGGLISFANLGPLAHPRQIVCLHDANVFLAPDSYSRAFRLAYRGLFPLLARRAARVTTVSAFSAAMLRKFGVTGRRGAEVIGNGHEHALRWRAAASRFAAPGAFTRPYVFALGSRAKHKRLDMLLGLAPALDALGIDLVVSGGTAAIFTGGATDGGKNGGGQNVIPVGFVSDDDLAALFAGALCFAFPSRTEGFGIPLLEAMVHGAPIVAADGASLPEVCGDAALYAPVDDPAAWLARIERLAADPSLRAELRARGRARYPLFSWRAAAGAYLDLASNLSPASAPSPTAAGAARQLPGVP